MTIIAIYMLTGVDKKAPEYYHMTEAQAEEARAQLPAEQRLDRLYGPEQPEISESEAAGEEGPDALASLKQALLDFTDALQYRVYPCYPNGRDLEDPAQETVERTFRSLGRLDPEIAASFKPFYDAWMEQARADWRAYDLQLMAKMRRGHA